MPNKMNLVSNAFRPSMEMDDPSRFAGRTKELIALAESLHVDGACPLIYGSRGLGKSSLALQALLMATGDSELLVKAGAAHLVMPDEDSFIGVYVSCSDSTPDTKSVLNRLINALLLLPTVAESGGKELAESSLRIKCSLKVFEAERSLTYRYTPTESTRDVEEVLIDLLNDVVDRTGHPVMLIVDELDRVRDTSGLASFIKGAAGRSIRFVLVGIGQTEAHLLEDHSSLLRKLHPIFVKPMSISELRLVIARAMDSLRERGVEMSFSEPAERRLARIASGFPWFVHLLGYRALMTAFTEGRETVERHDVDSAVSSVTDNTFAQHFADLYQRAIRDSPAREMVLRTFAKWDGSDIPTRDVYGLLKNRLGVANPSAYKGHLCQDEYGGIFITPPYQDRGVLRFSNEMFKIYINWRDSLYGGLKERVDSAWAEQVKEWDESISQLH